MEKEKKIDYAIRDTKLRLDDLKTELMLMKREQIVLQAQLETLELIRDNKDFE